MFSSKMKYTNYAYHLAQAGRYAQEYRWKNYGRGEESWQKAKDDKLGLYVLKIESAIIDISSSLNKLSDIIHLGVKYDIKEAEKKHVCDLEKLVSLYNEVIMLHNSNEVTNLLIHISNAINLANENFSNYYPARRSLVMMAILYSFIFLFFSYIIVRAYLPHYLFYKGILIGLIFSFLIAKIIIMSFPFFYPYNFIKRLFLGVLWGGIIGIAISIIFCLKIGGMNGLGTMYTFSYNIILSVIGLVFISVLTPPLKK